MRKRLHFLSAPLISLVKPPTPTPVPHCSFHLDQNFQQTHKKESRGGEVNMCEGWKMSWRGRRLARADGAYSSSPRWGLCGSAAVFSVVSTAVWWSAGATGGYRMSSVYSATWAQMVESLVEGTIDPTVNAGGKPGGPKHIRLTLRCHMSRVSLYAAVKVI